MQYSQKLLLSILLCLFLVQCSKKSTSEKGKSIQELDSLTVFPADSEPTYEVDLVQEQSFGGSGKPYWKVIAGCAVDDNDRVIIRGQNNDLTTELHVYNPDGTYRRQIGRFGKGPGEYQFISPNFQINTGRVFLHDETTGRLSMFTTDDYSFEGSTVLQDWNVRDLEAVRNMKLSDFRARSDGNLLAIFRAPPTGSGRTTNTKFMLVDTEGNALNPEPLIALPSPFHIASDNQGDNMLPISARIPLPFLGSSRFALTNDDEFYTARTDEFLIKKYDSEGTYQFAFYYPVKGPPFDMESFIERKSGPLPQYAFKNALEEVDIQIPESFSVIQDVRVDDENRIWVSVMVEYPETNEWWMLGESGELLAKVVLPDNETICDIQNGYLYAKFFDSQGDDPESWESKVIKYSINLTER
ncbi:6-bladed beta-propeller [Aliifodinibius sp. S!AR15-10]|uniref:6-bladed beta-propeller n=1 Tax=Aliifodinibius sp. S!AR15-10 TaxID=2950437 RepID=UPI00286162A5|nr:6-bladed beta-propeller [Aliifodinibius sp. S!AR15-10]MDR8393840.1 6-bladed beta-propeller [Aliifodinibius sp. S!AR15-10]